MGFTTSRIVNDENIKIPPEELIDSALYHQERDEYDIAEKEFITARINSMGTASESYIGKQVKEKLIVLYRLWVDYSIKEYDYINAEYILKKLDGIYPNKELVNKKYRELYEIWGNQLFKEKKYLGADSRFIKALMYDIKLNRDSVLESPLLSWLQLTKYSIKTKKEQDVAMKIYMIREGDKLHVLSIIAGILAIIYLLLCIIGFFVTVISAIAGKSSLGGTFTYLIFGVAVAPFYMFLFPAEQQRHSFRGSSIRYHASFTIISVICFVIFYISKLSIFYIIIYPIAIVFSFYCISLSIKTNKLYKMVQKSKLAVIKDIIKNRIPDEKLDLKIETPPPSAQTDANNDANLDYAIGRAGFHAGRFVAGQIFRNLRF